MANFKTLSSWLVNKEDDKPKKPERTAQKNEVFQETEYFVTLMKKFSDSFIPYQHLKMKRMHLIKDFLQGNDYLIKVYLKDAYFGKSFDKNSVKYIPL